ncbi:DUF3418 domain-containing protein, partial [Mycobacterium tuberculosis]|nr:DUF3418 domain-containing protein [Mycobacterium tuberculosis]
LVPITVSADDFDRDRIPAHLRIRFRLVDGTTTVGLGDDLSALTTQAKPAVRKARAKASPFAEKRGLTGWSVGDLPDPDAAEAGVVPGLADRG